jgi:hypothetical protein
MSLRMKSPLGLIKTPCWMWIKRSSRSIKGKTYKSSVT